jgi:hypothetical protein
VFVNFGERCEFGGDWHCAQCPADSILRRRNSASLLLPPDSTVPHATVISPPLSQAILSSRRAKINQNQCSTRPRPGHALDSWLPRPSALDRAFKTGKSRRSETPEPPPNSALPPPRSSPSATTASYSQAPECAPVEPKCPSTRGQPSSAATHHPGGNPVPPASRRSDGALLTARAVCDVPRDWSNVAILIHRPQREGRLARAWLKRIPCQPLPRLSNRILSTLTPPPTH